MLSDNETIIEESAILGFPAVTIRKYIERPEGRDTGNIVLTGINPDIFVQSVVPEKTDYELTAVTDVSSAGISANVLYMLIDNDRVRG